MKIRANYVSNSSSSSFVVTDVAKAIEAIRTYMQGIECMAAYRDYSRFLNKHKPVTDPDCIRMYVTNVYYYAAMHYEWYYAKVLRLKHNDACFDCGCYRSRYSCDFPMQQCGWYMSLLSMSTSRDSVVNWLKYIPTWEDAHQLLKYVRKQLNDTLSVTVTDGETYIDYRTNYTELMEVIRGLTDRWLEAHPDAVVLEFKSDNGDVHESEIRHMLPGVYDEYFANDDNVLFADNS